MAKGMRIRGLGKALPKKSLTNTELCQIVDSSDEWITSRTGIQSRYVISEETMTTLATLAAQEALSKSGCSKEEIDLVIVATVSPDQTMPSTACEVAKSLGLTNASCFDLSAACSGFIYATQIAYRMIQTECSHKAIIIGAEALSKVLDYEDRTTCVLFGDGAGAVVYEASEDDQILAIQTGSAPEGSDAITLPTIPFNQLFTSYEVRPGCIQMKGREVYCFATTKVPQSINEVLEEVQIEAKDIDWFLLHQANTRIMDSVAKKLKVNESKFFKNLAQCGNTSAASIPIALYDLSPQLKKGDRLILSGFGAGLTWGTMLIKWDL